MKEEILRQIFQIKNIDIADREKLCKIRSDKKHENNRQSEKSCKRNNE